MRERGLKFCHISCHISARLSLPMRERGLKWNEWFRDENLQNVAPHAGAWIEIPLLHELPW